MGNCIPEPGQDGGGAHMRGLQDDMSSIAATNTERSTKEETHPYSTVGSSNRSASKSTKSRKKTRQQAESYYPNRPSFLSQLFSTLLVLAAVGSLGCLIYIKLKQPLEDFLELVGDFVILISTYFQDFKDALQDFWNHMDVDWKGLLRLRNPADWWKAEDVDWDAISKVNFGVAVLTLALLVLDLLFSSDKKQGNPLMLAPLLFFSVVYAIISFNAQATGVLDAKVYMSFDTALIGEKIFKQPQIVVMTFTHLFALDLGMAFSKFEKILC
ncbi:MAG: hypothetical protein SGARI_003307 [Bacillariaceae sp.]